MCLTIVSGFWNSKSVGAQMPFLKLCVRETLERLAIFPICCCGPRMIKPQGNGLIVPQREPKRGSAVTSVNLIKSLYAGFPRWPSRYNPKEK